MHAGSSPRVWGKPITRPPLTKRFRVIPTCVGKTVAIGERVGDLAGHPHVCGENLEDPRGNLTLTGSSPRVWGKPSASDTFAASERVIPTCVGKTSIAADNGSSIAGHPHVCGENKWKKPEKSMTTGSSPRVWGKPCKGFPVPSHRRVIPTCVGKTHSTAKRIIAMTGHPHVCGENLISLCSLISSSGSSPRVWGKHSHTRQPTIIFRVIPTCVGKTCFLRVEMEG